MDPISILLDIVIVILFLILRALFTNWLALKLKWESSFRKGFIVNFTWFILLIIINFIIIFYGAPVLISLTMDANSVYLIFSFLVFIMNVIIGIFTVRFFYEKEYWGASVITIIVVISERIIIVIINLSIYFFFGSMLTGGFYLFTPF